MTLASRSFRRALLLTVAAVAVFAFGCKKPPKAEAPAPAPPPPPPAAPTVTLSANPSSIASGDSSTLSWTSTNATSVNIAPGVGTVVAEGNTRVTPSDSTTYTITATGPGGTANATTRVTVAAAPPPPPPKAEPTLNELFLREVQDAYFDFNKADIRSDAREALSHTANFLRNYPQVKVTIEGHCDERGSTEYNLGLGDRRAAATKNYLVSLGISADRISTVSYGKEKPFCMESNEDCWQKNRRGHFIKAN